MLEKQRCVLARIVVFVWSLEGNSVGTIDEGGQWRRYLAVRGEILDRPKTIISESIRQVHSFSIKNESRGIEDDQIPS